MCKSSYPIVGGVGDRVKTKAKFRKKSVFKWCRGSNVFVLVFGHWSAAWIFVVWLCESG